MVRALILWLLVGLPAAAGPADDAVRALLAGTAAPGAAAAVWNGSVAEVAAGGVRAVGSPDAVTADDPWHIGSNAKAMTATLVARLAESGAVSWDDTVGEVLGGRIRGIDPAFRDADYAALLAHRSGLRANAGFFTTLALTGTPLTRDERADRLRYAAAVLTAAPEGAPGGFLYSNAGYVVAGAMLEATTGQSWEELIRVHVWEPLGIRGAGFGAPGGDAPRGHRARLLGGLVPVEPGPRADNVPALGPAGTVHLPMADLLRFLAVHAAEDPGFLPPEAWRRLHVPPDGSGQAMGWRQLEDGTLTHNGSNTLWFATMSIRTDTGRAAALAVNYADFEVLRPLFAEVAAGLLAP